MSVVIDAGRTEIERGPSRIDVVVRCLYLGGIHRDGAAQPLRARLRRYEPSTT